MLITIDTSQPLKDIDRMVLEAYLSDTWPPSQPTAADGETAPAEEKPAPKKRAAKPKPEKEPEPEPEVDEESLREEYSLDDAVKAVRDAVSAGRKDDVKAALAKVGVKRASEMETAEQIGQFMEALNG